MRPADAEPVDALLQRLEAQAERRLLLRLNHELRTPLNAVLGFTQLLLAEAALEPGETAARRRERLRCIEQGGWAMVSLLERALEPTTSLTTSPTTPATAAARTRPAEATAEAEGPTH